MTITEIKKLVTKNLVIEAMNKNKSECNEFLSQCQKPGWDDDINDVTIDYELCVSYVVYCINDEVINSTIVKYVYDKIMMEQTNVTMAAEITMRQKKDLKALAKTLDRSVSSLVREALRDYLERNSKKLG